MKQGKLTDQEKETPALPVEYAGLRPGEIRALLWGRENDAVRERLSRVPRLRGLFDERGAVLNG